MRILFVTGCTLDQSKMAAGCSCGKAQLQPVIDWAVENELTLESMPCPETELYGQPRQPRGFKFYNNDYFRRGCAQRALVVCDRIEELSRDHDIVGIVGIMYSPSCSFLRNKSAFHPYGVFAEELEKEMQRRSLSLPTATVSTKSSETAIKKRLEELLAVRTESAP